ncbi:Iron-containing alcohol dehydrogenase [Phytophthora infestans]|uniref:Iron-containing alcohol dehydrogenase n=1 Tax=Phytophthora infestans TaxID=4787 RepID=A0A833S3N6_PHYIN|nr:Iron-containing alcohol dehydrogenase [Phytophthora infestans]
MLRLLRPHVHFPLRRHARCISSSFDARPHELSASGQPGRVLFGAKVAAKQLGALSRASGMRKVLLVRDRDAAAASRTQYAEFLLMQAGVPCFQYTLERDCATLEGVDHAAATAQRVGADGVVAFGGGNAMDTARAVAVVLANGGSAADFVTIRGDDEDDEELKLQQGKLDTTPLLLVPTIAGSGAEVARTSMLLEEDAETKLLFAPGKEIVPEAVIIDPTLMLTVPRRATVQGALTALGQCLESYLLGCADDATNELVLEGLEAVAGALAAPLKEGKLDLKGAVLREQFAIGSLLSGIAANSSGTGAAQALAVSMGGISDLPHAQVATAFLPFVFDRYAELARENEGDPFFDELREKLENAADRLTAASGFQGADVAAWLRYVITRFDLPTASTLELEGSLLNGLVDRAAQYQDESMEVSRSDDNGAIMEKDDLRAIIDAAVLVVEPTQEEEK